MKSLLLSNHDLKKNGYIIIRKLHKLENRTGKKEGYNRKYQDTYFFVLSIQALFDIFSVQYAEYDDFLRQCDSFMEYLEKASQSKARLNKHIIASFLRSYTRFFNCISKDNHTYRVTAQLIDMWNNKCLMSYIAAWENNNSIKES